jgi:hypothetical protein
MNLGIPTPSRYASQLYAASLIRGPGFSHSLGQQQPLATGGFEALRCGAAAFDMLLHSVVEW